MWRRLRVRLTSPFWSACLLHTASSSIAGLWTTSSESMKSLVSSITNGVAPFVPIKSYSHAQGKLAHNTENGYRNLIFNRIMPHFKSSALTELTEKKIQNFYKKLSDQGLSSRSVWCVHLLLRRILDEACRDGLLTENPAAGINVPHEENQPAMRLRSGQIRRYLEVAKELDVYPILYVGLTSGLRKYLTGNRCKTSHALLDDNVSIISEKQYSTQKPV